LVLQGKGVIRTHADMDQLMVWKGPGKKRDRNAGMDRCCFRDNNMIGIDLKGLHSLRFRRSRSSSQVLNR